MKLTAGVRLGPYEVLSAIGAGGMGEVWRARDTRLERDVAIKVLPSALAANAQLLTRFDREAKAISSLNHPHICTLHDVGNENGVHYLVMELIDGESLADRLSKGPLPPDQVLRYGAQIATGLAAAHRRGIVHRDLKPGNIMLTRSGAKLLDFGLARTNELTTIDGLAPTEARPLTAEGTIVGTFQYMAPEQLEGLPADQRTDIFALGAVLYEMATGRRAFDGKTKTSLIAAIVAGEPPSIANLAPLAPAGLSRVIELCLRKDPEDRWQSAHDVRLELESIREAAPASASRRGGRLWLAGIAAGFALAAVLSFLAGRSLRGEQRGEVTHLNVLSPAADGIEDLALSPDGRTLAMITSDGTGLRPQLWLRDLRTGNTRAVEGAAGAYQPFWSPDGQFVAFMRGATLQRVAARGGAVETICPIRQPRGGTWSAQGMIVFAESDGFLYKVDATGGDVQRLPHPAGTDLHWPSFLPDGQHLLVLSFSPRAQPHIAVASLDSSQPLREVVRARSRPSFAAPGYLLFVKSRTLLAQRLDLKTMTVSGPPVPLAQQVDDNDFNYFVFTASSTGTLAYRSRDIRSQLHLRDRSGRELARYGEPADWVGLTISPNGRHAIVERVDEERRNGKLWLLDLTSGALSQFSSGPGWNGLGAWAPDSERFAYLANPDGVFRMYEASVHSTAIRKIADFQCQPQSWVGDWISCETATAETLADIALVSASTGKRMDIAISKAWESSGSLSPDGKWIAYHSDSGESAAFFVEPVPPNGKRWKIASESGGAWSADGKSLYSTNGKTIFSTAVQYGGGAFRAEPPQPLLNATIKWFKNRMPLGMIGNGQKFLINEPVDNSSPAHVLLNWTALLPPG